MGDNIFSGSIPVKKYIIYVEPLIPLKDVERGLRRSQAAKIHLRTRMRLWE